jgi:photosynthetic reaction center cytochrome c subunit
MRRSVTLISLAIAAVCLCSLAGWNAPITAQDQLTAGSNATKTAEQQFKNIQVLKGIPADQLIPTMQFIAASLGVECEFCHVEHQMDKDDKKEKKTARKMISMELAIDKDHFDGNLGVTCYTCHRGTPHPVAVPIVSAENVKPAPHVHGDEAHANLPAANQILDKYLAAVGGAEALEKIKTRIQKGTIDAMGQQYPIEVLSEGPDKRISISHPKSGGSSVTAFNGDVGWLSIPNGFHRMTTAEAAAARIDAELYFPAQVREMYKEFRVLSPEEINGHQTYVVYATAQGLPALRLNFDQESGLLIRLTRYAETALGRNPTQIDYADYRSTGGVKIPYQWTLARPGGAFTIRVAQVQQNVPVDDKLFVPPAEGQGK